MQGLIHRLALRLAIGLALMGGAAVLAAMALTFISTLGKNARRFLDATFGPQDTWVWITSVLGEEEVVGLAIGFALLCCLPLLHLNRGHIRVDLAQGALPPWVNRWLDLLTDAGFAVLYALILWHGWLRVVKQTRGDALGFWDHLVRLDMAAALGRFRRGQTQILQIPEAPLRLIAEGLILLALLAVLYCTVQSFQRLRRP